MRTSVIEVVRTLWRVDRKLRREGFDATRQAFARDASTRLWDTRGIDALAREVHRFGRFWPGSACLHQALALASLIRRNGIDCELVLGAERNHGVIMAHAWIECDGRALDESGERLAKLAILARFPFEGVQ